MKRIDIQLLLIFVALIPLLWLRDFTPSNELRYISIADEALRNGQFFSFTNHGVAYCDKPPLYLWIVILGRWLFGQHCMFFISLFSVIPALLIIRVMDQWCRPQLTSEARLTGPWILFTTTYFIGTAIVLRMDMLMCLFITLALRTFYYWYMGIGNPRKHQWQFPLYVFLGIFTKAFMGFLIPFLTVFLFLLYKRQLKSFTRYWGRRTWIPILSGLALWFICVYAEGGKDYLYNLAIGQAVDRSVNVSIHKQPFYYYIYTLLYAIAPWTLFYIGATVVGIRRKALNNNPLAQLFLITIIGTIVMLSCFGSKLEVYLLPIFPFVAYLALIMSRQLSYTPRMALTVAIPAAILVLVAPGFLIALHTQQLNYTSPWLIAGSAIISIAGILALFFLYYQKNLFLAIRTCAMGILGGLFIGSIALPQLNGEIGYSQLIREAQNFAATHQTEQISTYRLRRAENIDAYLGHPVNILSAGELLDTLSTRAILITRQKHENDPALIEAVQNREKKNIGQYIIYAPL